MSAPADRLTPATCAEAMRRLAVEIAEDEQRHSDGCNPFHAAGRIIQRVSNASIPAPASPALPAMTAELVAALREWHAFFNPTVENMGPRDRVVLTAIERTPGLLPPPPSTAPLPAMWCGADAFEGEG